MSVGANGPYDIVLQDSPANPKLSLGLTLAYGEDSNAAKAWTEGRVPPIPPRYSTGTLNWTHKDPISDFVFSQQGWSGGCFEPYYHFERPNRYAIADGVDLRWEGVAALGPRQAPIRTGGTVKSKLQTNVYLANGDAEEGQAVGWSAGTGTTYTVQTASPRSGEYDHRLVVAPATAATTIMSQTIANPTVWRSRAVTVIAYVRRSAGSDAGIFMRLDDGVASADSSTITSSTYSYVSATITVDAAATSLIVRFVTSATTTNAAHTFFIDDVSVIPAGGVECVGTAIRSSASPAEAYAALGRTVVQWNETTFVWEAVYVDGSAAATDIIAFNGKVCVAFGEADGATPHQYITGSGTSWTTAAISGTTTHHDNHARYWVKARNGFGEYVLWKAGPSTDQGTERNTLTWAEEPGAGGAWYPTSAFTVGSASRAITRPHPLPPPLLV